MDFTKVHVILTPQNGGSVQDFTLQSLIGSASTGGQVVLSPSALMQTVTTGYNIKISMEADAVSGPSATINNLDFSFSGTAIN